MARFPGVGGGVPRDPEGKKIRGSGIGPETGPLTRGVSRPPGPVRSFLDRRTGTEPGTFPRPEGEQVELPQRELHPGKGRSIGAGRGAGDERGSGGTWLKQWLRPRRIADGGRVGGVYGAPEVRVSIKNARAKGDIWAEVQINQGTDIVHDLNRTLVELRPLGFRAGGSRSHAAQPRAQARARPALLLGAEAEATRFVGRDAELAILQQWHDNSDPFSVMLVHSSGGQGKTRLTRHFAGLVGARHDPPRLWEAISLTGTLIDNVPAVHLPLRAADPAPAARVPAHLVIADEADLWPRSKLVELLRSVNRPGERMRVLATARTFGWWWASLRTEPGLPEITWHEPLHLGPLDAATARQLAEAAGQSFADALGWPKPPPLPQQDLDQLADSPAASYELLVLARLYAANTGLSVPLSQRAAAELLLEQELRYWARMYGSDSTEDPYRIHLAPPFMARAVYLATLAGTFGYDIAQPIIQLADVGCYLRPKQIIEDHARCYPACDNQLLAPLPAGLAEQFLVMLVGDPGHTAGILPADLWATGVPFRLLGVKSPQERKPEDDIRKRCITAGEEPPPAKPQYSKVTFGPQLQPMIMRLTRAATSWPQVAEEQLYPLAYFYPRAVVMAGPGTVDDLLAMDPPRYVRKALDMARSECDPDDPQLYRQAMEELAAMRRQCRPARGGDS